MVNQIGTYFCGKDNEMSKHFSFFLTDIEDLTHKTGNFKQFHIFTSMLESAITQVRLQCEFY